jgi:hypothetical protein
MVMATTPGDPQVFVKDHALASASGGFERFPAGICTFESRAAASIRHKASFWNVPHCE